MFPVHLRGLIRVIGFPSGTTFLALFSPETKVCVKILDPPLVDTGSLPQIGVRGGEGAG